MKKSFLALLLCFLTAFSATAATLEDATALAKEIADDLVVNVMQAKTSTAEKRIRFEKIFVHEADMDTMTKFVLGAAFRTATPEQITRFKKAFTENFVLTWADRFNNYSGESVAFTAARQNNKDFYITSDIDIPNTDKPITVIWRIRESAKGLKVVDLVAEGVSMLQNYRKEYASVLQNNGNDVDALITLLENKNKTINTAAK